MDSSEIAKLRNIIVEQELTEAKASESKLDDILLKIARKNIKNFRNFISQRNDQDYYAISVRALKAMLKEAYAKGLEDGDD